MDCVGPIQPLFLQSLEKEHRYFLSVNVVVFFRRIIEMMSLVTVWSHSTFLNKYQQTSESVKTQITHCFHPLD